jgi:GT2 family glycosyltransferase
MSRFTCPRVDRPDVSIVIVSYNAGDVLSQALEALLRNTGPCYELILVENGSADGTPALVRQVENAATVLNTRNVGFGVGSNQGAARARGRYVLFLNQDVFVAQGWLPPLRAQMEANPRVGAVGPKLISPDGSLQCAGALLTRSGGAYCHGALDSPEQLAYGFARVVDYLAGACLLVRRAAFEDIGGFDPAYGLAYYEDADLCLALAANGYRSVYEPASSVTHVQGSPSGSVLEGAVRNRALFERRWRRALASRPLFPLGTSPRRTLAALEAPAAAAEDRDEFG